MELEAFEELKKEARIGEVKFIEDIYEKTTRIKFNIVDSEKMYDVPNLYIENQDNFNIILRKYIDIALNYYNLEKNYNNVKKILTFLFVNITNNEINKL